MDAIFGAAVPLLVDCMGVEQIHLGGGMSTKPDDSLFRFKSRVGRVPWTVFFEEVP
jgi:hypothetical protein